MMENKRSIYLFCVIVFSLHEIVENVKNLNNTPTNTLKSANTLLSPSDSPNLPPLSSQPFYAPAFGQRQQWDI